MAQAFNLTAQLNLRGPTNIRQIASQIRRDLGNVDAKVTFKLDPAVTRNVAGLTSSLKSLNAAFATTTKSATSASSAIKSFGSSINSINIKNLPQKIQASANAVSSLKKSSSSAGASIASASSEMVEFGKQAGLAVRRFTAFTAVTSVIYGVTNSINQGIQAFIDYDKQLTRLQQVTGESASGLTKLEQQISSLSTGLGVSSKELTEVSLTLAQAGLSARDTERALKALALSSLAPSFDNMNETVEGSIALMRQFDISAEDLTASLGSINAVAAKFAVESSDIITAIQRTGSVFATASKGVSEGKDALNEFIAVFTSVRATTRESAETIATGLRTIFTRIQRGSTIDALKEFGVNLTDAEGKFVGAYKAVELLSQGLNKIDPRSLDFSKIVEELGGFRQIGKVIPLIQQFSTAQEALKVAQKGQSSLATDAAVAQQSLANKIAKVREEFLTLFREIGKSQSFQTIVRGALDLASAFIKISSALKGLLPALAVMTAFKGIKALTEFTTGLGSGLRRGPDNKAGSGERPFFNSGGYVRKFARGGVVPGQGSGDTVPAMLEPGEFVIRKKAVEAIGANKLHKINKYAKGGLVKERLNKIKNKQGYGLNLSPEVSGIDWAQTQINLKEIKLDNQDFEDMSDIIKKQPQINKSLLSKYQGKTSSSNLERIIKFKENQNWLMGNAFQEILSKKYSGLRPIKPKNFGTNKETIEDIFKEHFAALDYEEGDAKFVQNIQSVSDTEILSKRLRNEFVNNRLKPKPTLKIDSFDLPPTDVYYPEPGLKDKFYKGYVASVTELARRSTGYNTGGRVKFATGGKALGARSKFKELSPEEILKLDTKDLIAYGKALARDIFTTGGAGMAVGSEFIEVPTERIVPELESSLVSYMGKRGFWREKVAPFGRPSPAVSKKSQKLDRQSALETQVAKYSDEVAAREQQWTKIRNGSAIDNYLLSSLTDPILSDYRTVRSGGSLEKAFHNTRLRQAVNKSLESYDDFDYSPSNIDKLVSGMAAKRFAYGGLVQKFAAGTDVKPVGPISEDILQRLKDLGGAGPIKEAVGLDFIMQTVRSQLGDRRITAKQLLNPKSLRSMQDSAALEPAITPILKKAEELRKQKDQAKKDQIARNLQAASGGAYRFGLASIFGPNGEFGYSDVSNAIEIEGKDGEKYLTQIVQKSLPKRYEAVIDKIRQSLMSVPQIAAEELQYVDIFGTEGPLAFDFDDTLVKGASIPGEKFSDYNDLTKVEKALEGAKLTSLGQELKQRLQKYPQLLDNVRILTARPQNNASLLAATLQKLELPITEDKITGVSGGLNKVNNLSDMETLIDDNLENIESVLGGGKKAIPYREAGAVNLADTSSRKSISTMEGYALEEMVRSLGVYVSDDNANPGRPIDFPKGLGIHASKWDLPPTIPTDTKRTNSSSAVRRLEEEAQRFYIQNFATGGEVEDKTSFEKVKKQILEKYPNINFRISKRKSGFGYNLMGGLKQEGSNIGNYADFQQPSNLENLVSAADKMANSLLYEYGPNIDPSLLKKLQKKNKLAKGGDAEKQYKQILASILPASMLTPDGFLKKSSGQAEPISITNQSEHGAYYAGGLNYKMLRYRLEQDKSKIPDSEYAILKRFVDENIAFEGEDDTIDIRGGAHKGVLPHETFHDIQGHLYDYYPQIVEKLFEAIEKRKSQIKDWMTDPSNSEWTGPRDYTFDHFFLSETSPYANFKTDIVEQSTMAFLKKNKELPSIDALKIIQKAYVDIGKNEVIPVLLSAAAVGNRGATSILTDIFEEAGLNSKFYESLPRYADGGLASDEMSSLITGLYGAPGSISRSFQGAGINQGMSSTEAGRSGTKGVVPKDKKARRYGKIGLRNEGSQITATYFRNDDRSGSVTAKKFRDNLYTVALSKATQGYGPRLYDVVMEAATASGSMLTSDRNQVTAAARGVWEFYFKNRSDVKKTPLDPSQWTTNSSYIDPKLYGKKETWPPPTDPAWILQTGYSKSPELINGPDVLDMNDPKYEDYVKQQQLNFLSRNMGGFIKKFAKGGSAEDTVPALLTPGEFVINKKAAQKIGYSKLNKLNHADKLGTDIEGYNKGGAVGGFVQKFASGGSASSVDWLTRLINDLNKMNPRPQNINKATVGVDENTINEVRSLAQALNELGVSVANTADILNRGGQTSYEAIEKAMEKDVKRLKIAGASIDQISAAESGLSRVRQQGEKQIQLQKNLEGMFAQRGSPTKKIIDGTTIGNLQSGSGAGQQAIETQAQILASRRLELLRNNKVDITPELQQKVTSSAYLTSASRISGIKKSDFKAAGIEGTDIQKYISESMRHRQTLAQMDKQLVALKIEEYQRAGKTAAEARKAANEEISERRKIINDLAKQRGEGGVGAARFLDVNNSPIWNAAKDRYRAEGNEPSLLGFNKNVFQDLGVAVGVMTSVMSKLASVNQGSLVDADKIQAAGKVAGIEQAGTTMSVGLTAASNAMMIPGVGPYLAAATALGTVTYAVADYFKDFSGTQKKAINQATKALLDNKLQSATDSLANSFKQLSIDANNVELISKTAKDISYTTDLITQLGDIERKTNKDEAETRTLDQWLLGGGPLQSLADAFGGRNSWLARNSSTGIGSMDTNINKGKYGPDEIKRDSLIQAARYEMVASQAYDNLSQLYRSGMSNQQIMDPSNEFGKIVRSSIDAMILKNTETLTKYNSFGDNTEAREAFMNRERENFLDKDPEAKARQKTEALARAMEIADKAGRRLAASFDKLADSVNQSVNRVNFEAETRAESSNQTRAALRGESQVSGPRLRETNILSNPSAYTEEEFNNALQTATSGISDPKVRQQLIGGAQLQQTVPKAVTESIAKELAGKRSTDVDDALPKAIAAAKSQIDANNNLSPEQKEDLKNIAETRITGIAEKAKNNNKGSAQLALSEFTKELGDGQNILGDFGKKLLDSVKALSEFKQGALARFAEGLNEASKAAKEAQNYFKKARDIRNQGNMNLREVMTGVGETYEEKRSRIMGDVSDLTGGVTDVNGITARMKDLTRQRMIEQENYDSLSDPAALKKSAENLNNLDNQLRDTKEALDMLADSTELVDKAFDDLKNVAQLQDNRKNFVNSLITNTPEEADKLNQTMIRLQRNLSGGLNGAGNQRDARKAFNETLRQTGSVREATRAGNTVLANQRKETLALMNDPGFRAAQELNIRNQYAMGKGQPGVSADQAVADYFKNQEIQVTKQMAIESGMINNPLVQQSLAAMQDRNADPAMKQAAERYLEAIGLKADATKAQGELKLMESNFALVDANNNLKTSIDDLNATIIASVERNQLGDNAPPGMVPMPVGVAAPVMPQSKAKGGLIYASAGKLVEFKPRGTDTIPAMLTPGEFVINARSTADHLPLLQAINDGSVSKGDIPGYSKGGIAYLSTGGSVYDNMTSKQFDNTRSSWLPSERFGNKDNGRVIRLADGQLRWVSEEEEEYKNWYNNLINRMESSKNNNQNSLSLLGGGLDIVGGQRRTRYARGGPWRELPMTLLLSKGGVVYLANGGDPGSKTRQPPASGDQWLADLREAGDKQPPPTAQSSFDQASAAATAQSAAMSQRYGLSQESQQKTDAQIYSERAKAPLPPDAWKPRNDAEARITPQAWAAGMTPQEYRFALREQYINSGKTEKDRQRRRNSGPKVEPSPRQQAFTKAQEAMIREQKGGDPYADQKSGAIDGVPQIDSSKTTPGSSPYVGLPSSMTPEEKAEYDALNEIRRKDREKSGVPINGYYRPDPLTEEQQQRWKSLHRKRELDKIPTQYDNASRIVLKSIDYHKLTPEQQEELHRLNYQRKKYEGEFVGTYDEFKNESIRKKEEIDQTRYLALRSRIEQDRHPEVSPRDQEFLDRYYKTAPREKLNAEPPLRPQAKYGQSLAQKGLTSKDESLSLYDRAALEAYEQHDLIHGGRKRDAERQAAFEAKLAEESRQRRAPYEEMDRIFEDHRKKREEREAAYDAEKAEYDKFMADMKLKDEARRNVGTAERKLSIAQDMAEESGEPKWSDFDSKPVDSTSNGIDPRWAFPSSWDDQKKEAFLAARQQAGKKSEQQYSEQRTRTERAQSENNKVLDYYRAQVQEAVDARMAPDVIEQRKKELERKNIELRLRPIGTMSPSLSPDAQDGERWATKSYRDANDYLAAQNAELRYDEARRKSDKQNRDREQAGRVGVVHFVNTVTSPARYEAAFQRTYTGGTEKDSKADLGDIEDPTRELRQASSDFHNMEGLWGGLNYGSQIIRRSNIGIPFTPLALPSIQDLIEFHHPDFVDEDWEAYRAKQAAGGNPNFTMEDHTNPIYRGMGYTGRVIGDTLAGTVGSTARVAGGLGMSLISMGSAATGSALGAAGYTKAQQTANEFSDISLGYTDRAFKAAGRDFLRGTEQVGRALTFGIYPLLREPTAGQILDSQLVEESRSAVPGEDMSGIVSYSNRTRDWAATSAFFAGVTGTSRKLARQDAAYEARYAATQERIQRIRELKGIMKDLNRIGPPGSRKPSSPYNPPVSSRSPRVTYSIPEDLTESTVLQAQRAFPQQANRYAPILQAVRGRDAARAASVNQAASDAFTQEITEAATRPVDFSSVPAPASVVKPPSAPISPDASLSYRMGRSVRRMVGLEDRPVNAGVRPSPAPAPVNTNSSFAYRMGRQTRTMLGLDKNQASPKPSLSTPATETLDPLQVNAARAKAMEESLNPTIVSKVMNAVNSAYAYEATNSAGQLIKDIVYAASEKEAMRLISRQGLKLIKLQARTAPVATGYSQGGPVYLAKGGHVKNKHTQLFGGFKRKGKDRIPAMLEDGEFVINAESASKNLGLLHRINNNKIDVSKNYVNGGKATRGNSGISYYERYGNFGSEAHTQRNVDYMSRPLEPVALDRPTHTSLPGARYHVLGADSDGKTRPIKDPIGDVLGTAMDTAMDILGPVIADAGLLVGSPFSALGGAIQTVIGGFGEIYTNDPMNPLAPLPPQYVRQGSEPKPGQFVLSNNTPDPSRVFQEYRKAGWASTKSSLASFLVPFGDLLDIPQMIFDPSYKDNPYGGSLGDYWRNTSQYFADEAEKNTKMRSEFNTMTGRDIDRTFGGIPIVGSQLEKQGMFEYAGKESVPWADFAFREAMGTLVGGPLVEKVAALSDASLARKVDKAFANAARDEGRAANEILQQNGQRNLNQLVTNNADGQFFTHSSSTTAWMEDAINGSTPIREGGVPGFSQIQTIPENMALEQAATGGDIKRMVLRSDGSRIIPGNPGGRAFYGTAFDETSKGQYVAENIARAAADGGLEGAKKAGVLVFQAPETPIISWGPTEIAKASEEYNRLVTQGILPELADKTVRTSMGLNTSITQTPGFNITGGVADASVLVFPPSAVNPTHSMTYHAMAQYPSQLPIAQGIGNAAYGSYVTPLVDPTKNQSKKSEDTQYKSLGGRPQGLSSGGLVYLSSGGHVGNKDDHHNSFIGTSVGNIAAPAIAGLVAMSSSSNLTSAATHGLKGGAGRLIGSAIDTIFDTGHSATMVGEGIDIAKDAITHTAHTTHALKHAGIAVRGAQGARALGGAATAGLAAGYGAFAAGSMVSEVASLAMGEKTIQDYENINQQQAQQSYGQNIAQNMSNPGQTAIQMGVSLDKYYEESQASQNAQQKSSRIAARSILAGNQDAIRLATPMDMAYADQQRQYSQDVSSMNGTMSLLNNNSVTGSILLDNRIPTQHKSSGGIIYANNGALAGLAGGTDTVPAMLTPGEFVVNREAARTHMPILQAINSGYFNRGGIINYLANGGIVTPKYYAEGGSTLRIGGLQKGGVSSNIGGDISGAISSALGQAVGQLSEFASNITTGLQQSIEQYGQISQTMGQSMATFSSSAAQIVGSANTYYEAATAMPNSISAQMNGQIVTNHTGLDSLAGNIEQNIYQNTSKQSSMISQNAVANFDRIALEGNGNTAANSRPMV